MFLFKCYSTNPLGCRPTNPPSDQEKNGKLEAGIADDQAKDFDFAKTEMKYDSTGMFHWTPARSIEDCILVILLYLSSPIFSDILLFRTVTKLP